MGMMGIDAFIFDVDGVLTDTVESHYRSWKQLAEEEGIPFSRVINDEMRGLSRTASLQVFLAGRAVSEEQMADYLRRKNDYFLSQLGDLSGDDLLPGVLPLLRELKEAGIKIGVGSASKNAREVVRRLDIGEYMDAYADGHVVERSKPAPDVFLAAAGLLGIRPQACVVVEDAESGIEAAHGAGMRVIGVGSSVAAANADLWLKSLAGVSLTQIAASLATEVTQASGPRRS